MTFRQYRAENYAACVLDTDAFAERVTYRPRGGGDREISALVKRDPPSVHPQTGVALAPRCVVAVACDETLGITAAELDVGADQLLLPRAVDGSIEARIITKIIHQSTTRLVIEVR